MSRRERKSWKETQQQMGPQLDNRPAYTVRGSPTYDDYEPEGSRYVHMNEWWLLTRR